MTKAATPNASRHNLSACLIYRPHRSPAGSTWWLFSISPPLPTPKWTLLHTANSVRASKECLPLLFAVKCKSPQGLAEDEGDNARVVPSRYRKVIRTRHV